MSISGVKLLCFCSDSSLFFRMRCVCVLCVFCLQEVGRGIWVLALLKLVPVPLAKFLVYTGLAKRLSAFFKMAPRSLTEVINELTENKDLRAVFSYIFGTYGRTKLLLCCCTQFISQEFC